MESKTFETVHTFSASCLQVNFTNAKPFERLHKGNEGKTD
jgi:hypothetical protein